MIPYLTEGLGLALVGALAWGGAGHYEANSLRADLAEKTLELSDCNRNKETCDRNLRFQNQAIEDQRIDYEGRLANFEPVTITETIIKYVPQEVNVTRGDCNDTNYYLDFIRTNGID